MDTRWARLIESALEASVDALSTASRTLSSTIDNVERTVAVSSRICVMVARWPSMLRSDSESRARASSAADARRSRPSRWALRTISADSAFAEAMDWSAVATAACRRACAYWPRRSLSARAVVQSALARSVASRTRTSDSLRTSVRMTLVLLCAESRASFAAP